MNRPEQPFPDAPLSIPEQVELLIARGMEIGNREEAASWLAHVGLYRLRGYYEPLDVQSRDDERRFQDRVSFTDVVERYVFDQRLRNLLLSAFDHIEVSLRVQWSYNLAHAKGGGRFAHRDSALFGKHHGINLYRLEQGYEKSYDLSKEIHQYPFTDCPVWGVTEAMSFGEISKWYADTNLPIRRSVARRYGTDEKILKSVLYHLTIVRNICAHHERLWDRDLQSTFTIPKRLDNDRNANRIFSRRAVGRMYNTLIMVAYLMERINPLAGWPQRLTALLDEYDHLPLSSMGMPSDWRTKLQSACEAAGGQ